MVYLQQLLVTSLSRCNECRGSRSHKLLVIGFCFLLTISTGGSTLGLFTKNGMNSRGEHKCIQLVFISDMQVLSATACQVHFEFCLKVFILQLI